MTKYYLLNIFGWLLTFFSSCVAESDVVCISRGIPASLLLRCASGTAVFTDIAMVRKAQGQCASGDVTCVTDDVMTEYVRSQCYNMTSCDLFFNYTDYQCPAFDGTLYISVTYKCMPVLTVREQGLPSAALAGSVPVEQSGPQMMVSSVDYPSWLSPANITCRILVPATSIIRLDIMDLSHNGTINTTYCLHFGHPNSPKRQCLEKGSHPSTLLEENKDNTNVSIFMNLTIEQSEQYDYTKSFMRFFFYLSVVNFDSTFSSESAEIVCQKESENHRNTSTNVMTTSENTDVNVNVTKSPDIKHIERYSVGAMVGGATACALLLIIFIFIIALIMGTRKKPRPPPAIAEQDLRYHVHANIVAATIMREVQENKNNLRSIEQVHNLNNLMESAVSETGTLDSRVPLESYMTVDIADDSAYDSSTEPVRSLENLNFTNPLRRSKPSYDNPLFLSLYRPRDENLARPVPRVRSMHIEQSKYDHHYENHMVTRPRAARAHSMLSTSKSEHTYENHFATHHRGSKRRTSSVKRSTSQRQRHSDRIPKRTRSWYNMTNQRGIDHIKPVHPKPRPADNVYYNTQPLPVMRKSPRRLKPIPSAGSDSQSENKFDKPHASGEKKHTFQVLGSSLSLTEGQSSNDRSSILSEQPQSVLEQPQGVLGQPRGLLFFSNTSINAMLQDKQSARSKDLYALPQKKRKSGFVKLTGGDSGSTDHDA